MDAKMDTCGGREAKYERERERERAGTGSTCTTTSGREGDIIQQSA